VVRDWNEGAEPGKEVEESWDTVVVAIVWYDNLVCPETDGLEELRKRGRARHAKWWRGPEVCKGKVSKRPFFRDGDFLGLTFYYCRGSLLSGTQTLPMTLPHIQHP